MPSKSIKRPYISDRESSSEPDFRYRPKAKDMKTPAFKKPTPPAGDCAGPATAGKPSRSTQNTEAAVHAEQIRDLTQQVKQAEKTLAREQKECDAFRVLNEVAKSSGSAMERVLNHLNDEAEMLTEAMEGLKEDNGLLHLWEERKMANEAAEILRLQTACGTGV